MSNSGVSLNSFLLTVKDPPCLGTGLESPLGGMHPVLHHNQGLSQLVSRSSKLTASFMPSFRCEEIDSSHIL